jgi:hypothetical protein
MILILLLQGTPLSIHRFFMLLNNLHENQLIASRIPKGMNASAPLPRLQHHRRAIVAAHVSWKSEDACDTDCLTAWGIIAGDPFVSLLHMCIATLNMANIQGWFCIPIPILGKGDNVGYRRVGGLWSPEEKKDVSRAYSEPDAAVGGSMHGMVNFIIAAMAAFFLYDSGHAFPSVLAVLVAIVAFGSWGVMFRYDPRIRMKQLKRLRSTMLSEGRPPEEISRLDTYIKTSGQAGTPSVPRWLALVNYISFIGGFILLIWGVMSIVR